VEKSVEQTLQAIIDQTDEVPSVVIMSAEFVGNRTGYIALALAALRASRGEQIELKKEEWCSVEDLDYRITRFKYDESAHIYRPEIPSRRRRILGNLMSLGFLLVIAGLVLAGVVEVIHLLNKSSN